MTATSDGGVDVLPALAALPRQQRAVVALCWIGRCQPLPTPWTSPTPPYGCISVTPSRTFRALRRSTSPSFGDSRRRERIWRQRARRVRRGSAPRAQGCVGSRRGARGHTLGCFVSELRSERRRVVVISHCAVAPAVLLMVLTAGRSVVVTAGGALELSFPRPLQPAWPTSPG